MYTPMSPDTIQELTAFELTDEGLADCHAPDALDSPGAHLLLWVRDEVLRIWSELNEETRAKVYDELDLIASKAADQRSPQRWAEFVDLAAYEQEPDYGYWPEDLTEAAGAALEQIANRLAKRLYMHLQSWKDEQE